MVHARLNYEQIIRFIKIQNEFIQLELNKRSSDDNQKEIKKQRYLLLRRFEELFETPMIILGFVWIALLILELLNKTNHILLNIGIVIWIIFILDFIIKFILAPVKSTYLKRNILTIISLIVPAFRILKILRLIRFIRITRGLRLVKVLGSLNRGMRALALTMKRRAFGYVTILTLIVLFTGAAGMHAFEKDVNEGLKDYGTALWWTGMILTTMGSDYWPATTEGRVLCITIAIYAFAVFGYVTAVLATFFIGRDAENKGTELAGSSQLNELRKEIQELKKLLKDK